MPLPSQTLPDGREAQPPVYGPLLEVLAEIKAMLGTQQTQQQQTRTERNRLNQQIYPVPDIACGQLDAASQTLDLPEVMGPRLGNTWFVTRLTCEGFTAGTVNVYYDNVFGTPVITFSSSGTFTFNTSQFPVTRGHRLVFQSQSTFSGTAQISIGVVNVADELVGAYLL